MKSLIVFFVFLILVTLVSYFVSMIPPGEFLYNLLNLKNVASFSPLILKSLISGFVWGIVIGTIFSLARKSAGEKSLTEIAEKKPEVSEFSKHFL